MTLGSSNPPPALAGEKSSVLVPGLGFRVGQVVAARYRIEGLVRCTASTVTLQAHHIHLREPVTLELFAAYGDADRAQCDKRIERARIAARFRSAHVPRTVDIGTTEDGMPYVATARLEGPTLEEELQARGRLPYEEAVGWVLQACIGLAEAHGHGLVHGDLEPKRFVLAHPETVQRDRPPEAKQRKRRVNEPVDPGSRVLVVTEIGVADGIEALGEASASTWWGSPAYTSPEQLKTPDAVDARADVWGLGVLLYELVQGEPPFAADTVSSILVSVAYDAAPLITEGPYDLARVVHRCLSKDPAARPQDVAELARLLAPFAGTHAADLVERVVVTGASARAIKEREEKARRSRPVAATAPSTPAVSARSEPPPVARTVAPPPRRGKRLKRGHATKHLARVIVDADTGEGGKPAPLVRRRDDTTGPSARIRAEQKRFGKIAIGCALGGALIALVGWAASPRRDAVGTTTTTNAIVVKNADAAESSGAESTTSTADEGSRIEPAPRPELEVPPALPALDANAVPEAARDDDASRPIQFSPAPTRSPAPRRTTLAPNPFLPGMAPTRSPAPLIHAPPITPKVPARPANAIRAPHAEKTHATGTGLFGSRK